MPEEPIVLRKHRLRHIPALAVRRAFFTRQFAPGCSMANCNADCCRYGVMVDPVERDRILAHREMILKYMEPHQERDPAKWFEDPHRDPDFPSGTAVGTQARDYGCVFLDSSGRCVLQKAAMGEGLDKFFLKPFFCVAYPVTIEDGELMIDDADFVSRPACCTPVGKGAKTVFEVCRDELEFVLGEEGMFELRDTAKKLAG
ncbi:MAG: DUF3109 family protein [Ignavibacteriales bacterium]|nr:DUF3109 family protein [Ignavibacteriales bacterium]